MRNFKECKKEWLENEQEEKMLITEIQKKVEIILEEQKMIGRHFSFPCYETIEEIKTHH